MIGLNKSDTYTLIYKLSDDDMQKHERVGRPMNSKIIIKNIMHWPTLKTVLMVEDVLREACEPLSIEEIKRRLKTKIMDQTLRVILAYFEEQGDILIGKKGITWIRNDNPKFLKMLKKAKMMEV